MKIKKIVLMLGFLSSLSGVGAVWAQSQTSPGAGDEGKVQDLKLETFNESMEAKAGTESEGIKKSKGVDTEKKKPLMIKDISWKGPATFEHFKETLGALKSKKILSDQDKEHQQEALKKAIEVLKDRKINDPSWDDQRSQIVLVADVTPNEHVLHVNLWDGQSLMPLESFAVSGGGTPRQDHFYSPEGWHVKKASIIDFRAEGTVNENGIRGYGLKGSRIWDFGWVPAQSSWKKNLNIPIRFQMHATDPVLQARFGKEASKGCIRIPQDLNRVLDGAGALDYQYLQEKNKAQQWVLGPHDKLKEAGDVLVVVKRQSVKDHEVLKVEKAKDMSDKKSS